MEMTREEACKAAGLEIVDNVQPIATESRVAIALMTGVGAVTAGRVVLDNGKPLDAPQAAALGLVGVGMGVSSYYFSKDIKTDDQGKTILKEVASNLTVFTLSVVCGKAIGKLLS